jgi:hypothetical protein
METTIARTPTCQDAVERRDIQLHGVPSGLYQSRPGCARDPSYAKARVQVCDSRPHVRIKTTQSTSWKWAVCKTSTLIWSHVELPRRRSPFQRGQSQVDKNLTRCNGRLSMSMRLKSIPIFWPSDVTDTRSAVTLIRTRRTQNEKRGPILCFYI